MVKPCFADDRHFLQFVFAGADDYNKVIQEHQCGNGFHLL